MLTAGLERMFSDSTMFEVVGCYSDLASAMEALPLRRPHVLLLNPSQMDYSKRLMLRRLFQDYPKLLLVALQTTYVEQAVLNQFHAVIELDDNLSHIESKLLAAMEGMVEETRSPAEAPEVYARLAREKSFPVVQFDWGMLG